MQHKMSDEVFRDVCDGAQSMCTALERVGRLCDFAQEANLNDRTKLALLRNDIQPMLEQVRRESKAALDSTRLAAHENGD